MTFLFAALTTLHAVRRLPAIILVTTVMLLNGTAAATSLDYFINQVKDVEDFVRTLRLLILMGTNFSEFRALQKLLNFVSAKLFVQVNRIVAQAA